MSIADLNNSNLITNKSIQEFFHDSVHNAVENQQIDASGETIFYLVNLLTAYSRSEQLFEQTHYGIDVKPLALIYAQACEQPNQVERMRLLQRLGDTALFISGIFSESLNRKLVDIDYYIAMGGNAYASVSDTMRNSYHSEAAQQLFEELTEKFTDFVDVLSEVSENANLSSNGDVLRLYEIWIRTGSKRAEAKLRKLGIDPVSSSKAEFQH
ncbi:hypothetical protein [Kaarinaea lacus]